MSRYQVTPAADADLEEIWQRISSEAGPMTADSVEQELHVAMVRVGEFPHMGRLREDLADEPLRVVVVHRFLIIYRAENTPVEIVRVLHGARDVEAVLRGMS